MTGTRSRVRGRSYGPAPAGHPLCSVQEKLFLLQQLRSSQSKNLVWDPQALMLGQRKRMDGCAAAGTDVSPSATGQCTARFSVTRQVHSPSFWDTHWTLDAILAPLTKWLQNMSPNQEDFEIKTNSEDCIFPIVSQDNYASLGSSAYHSRKETATGDCPCTACCPRPTQPPSAGAHCNWQFRFTYERATR